MHAHPDCRSLGGAGPSSGASCAHRFLGCGGDKSVADWLFCARLIHSCLSWANRRLLGENNYPVHVEAGGSCTSWARSSFPHRLTKPVAEPLRMGRCPRRSCIAACLKSQNGHRECRTASHSWFGMGLPSNPSVVRLNMIALSPYFLPTSSCTVSAVSSFGIFRSNLRILLSTTRGFGFSGDWQSFGNDLTLQTLTLSNLERTLQTQLHDFNTVVYIVGILGVSVSGSNPASNLLFLTPVLNSSPSLS